MQMGLSKEVKVAAENKNKLETAKIKHQKVATGFNKKC
jgi:hypothetical protein